MRSDMGKMIVLLLWLGETELCSGNIFASTSELRVLYEREEKLLQAVEDYMYQEEERLHTMRRMVHLRRNTRLEETEVESPLDYVGHPLNSFRLIQQLSDINTQMTNNKSLQDFQTHLSDVNLYLPEEVDRQGAYKAIARLQNTYNLSVGDLMNGTIRGRKAFHKLSMEEVIRLTLAPRMWGGKFYSLLGRLHLFDFIQETHEPWSAVWIDTVIEKAYAFLQMENLADANDLMETLVANDPENLTLINIQEEIKNTSIKMQEFLEDPERFLNKINTLQNNVSTNLPKNASDPKINLMPNETSNTFQATSKENLSDSCRRNSECDKDNYKTCATQTDSGLNTYPLKNNISLPPQNDTIYEEAETVEESETKSTQNHSDSTRNVDPSFQYILDIRRTRLNNHYQKMCQGENVPQMFGVKGSVCWYRPTFVPYYKVKEEIIQTYPKITIMYDVISDTEAQSFKQMAMEQMETAKVNIGKLDEGRVGKLRWIGDGKQDVPSVLSTRISWFTGLITHFPVAEYFQVLNYGIGGQYIPHTDPLEKIIPRINGTNIPTFPGDRMATFMFYLSQPEAGGDTVFPLLNVRVPVVKNSAVLWYNFKRSGEKDNRMLHAGCPVLLGEKWIANKWIHENTQEFRRPCGLTPNAEDDLMPESIKT